MTLPSHKTKIVATIGPASDSADVAEQMIRAGMDIARLNFSHGTFEEHGRRIAMLRAAAKVAGRELTLMADLPGPKMRIGVLTKEPVELGVGAPFTLTTDDIMGDASRVSVNFGRLPRVVKPGDKLYLNDGLIRLEVVEVSGADVRCLVRVGGELRSHKGLNLPGIDLGISAFTERDRECLDFAISHGVEAVSQSFVESGADVHAVRDAAAARGAKPLVIAKIERARALDKVDEILAAADGLMIARGDLGVEVPIERIAILQKSLVRKAVHLGKPVITATQMLESMTRSPQPTRAEATDVANAVVDGTDCVMLSGESAVGRFPVEAVATLARIAAVTEPSRPRLDLWEELKRISPDDPLGIADLYALGVEAIMASAHVAAVVVVTRGGTMARGIARLRLPVWIAAICSGLETCRRLQFVYGVQGICEPKQHAEAELTTFVRQWIAKEKLAGKLAILIAGHASRNPPSNPRLELIDLGFAS
jgi:pyruvate kinase